jgi:hypothetical protein
MGVDDHDHITSVFECAHPQRTRFAPVGSAGPTFHNANHTALVEGPTITLTPLHARVHVERGTVCDEILDTIVRIQQRTGVDTFARHEGR